MGRETVDTNIVDTETRREENMTVDSEKVNIKFGSHVVVEPSKEEVKKVSDNNLPRDVVDEWPEPKQVHSFYVVRYRALEDDSLKVKLDAADKDLQIKNQARLQIVEKLKAKRADRSQVITQLRSLIAENKQFRTIMDEKRKEMEPLQQALGKLRGSGGRDRGLSVCSSEEELNDIIKSLQYRIQHESIPLSEEKQILRDIKQLEGTREKVIANSAERARIQAAMGETEAIQGQVKSIGVDLDEVRKEKQAVNAKLKQLDDEKLAVEKEISVLEEELTAVTQKRNKTFETIVDMRKQREEGNSPFYQHRVMLSNAKSLAANKDVDALKKLSAAQVSNFMTLWNSNKAFREDYEKRILPSLDQRQLSRDGRMRNPGEKPLGETSIPSETEVVKATTKPVPKEDVVIPTPGDISSEQKVQKPQSAARSAKDGNKKDATLEKHDQVDEEEYFSSDRLRKDSLPKKNEVDEEKLKQLKREEEIAKRKQAEERKKKLAEKAAAKAAVKAQKEAEKKLKEREKKARKKAGVADTVEDFEETTEPIAEVSEEPPVVEEKIETPVPQKSKDRKVNTTIRHRGRTRGRDTLPKAVLKRNKAINYWMWGAYAGSALVILLLAFLGYRYLS